MREVLGVSLSSNYDILKSCSVGICWPLENLCILSDSPSKISMSNGVLHCETGPAILYRDGTEVFALHGIKMLKGHVETAAEGILPETVLAETNADVRRELLRKVGIERMLAKLPHSVMEKRGNYELLNLLELNGIRNARFLKMINPSIGVFHVEGVDPSCSTIEQSLNWRNSNWHTNAEILT